MNKMVDANIIKDDDIFSAYADAPAGSRVEGRLHIGEMASGSPFFIPFVMIKGNKPGPSLWINGQVHGCEITGMVAGLEFVNGLNPEDMTGTVIVTATGNPLGLDGRSYIVPQDATNLDQSYPGDPRGFVSARIAHVLYQAVTAIKPDLVISMHAQGTLTASQNYGVYKIPEDCQVTAEFLMSFIADFDPVIICRMNTKPGAGELAGNHAGALDNQLNLVGIPTFMVELGIGQRVLPEDTKNGLMGFERVARRLGILPGGAHKQQRRVRHATKRGHHPILRGGLFRPHHWPTEIIPAGEALGEVMNLHGHVVERPTFDHDVVVIAVRTDPVVHSGDRVAFIAHEWEEIVVG